MGQKVRRKKAPDANSPRNIHSKCIFDKCNGSCFRSRRLGFDDQEVSKVNFSLTGSIAPPSLTSELDVREWSDTHSGRFILDNYYANFFLVPCLQATVLQTSCKRGNSRGKSGQNVKLITVII